MSETTEKLYLEIYKKRIEKIKLDLEINTLKKEAMQSINKKNKLKRNKIYFKVLKLINSLIISLILTLYAFFYINKIILINFLSHTTHICIIIISTLLLGISGAFFLSKLEGKIKERIKNKEINISNELEHKLAEIKNKENKYKKICSEIENIEKEIKKLENINSAYSQTINTNINITSKKRYKQKRKTK